MDASNMTRKNAHFFNFLVFCDYLTILKETMLHISHPWYTRANIIGKMIVLGTRKKSDMNKFLEKNVMIRDTVHVKCLYL